MTDQTLKSGYVWMLSKDGSTRRKWHLYTVLGIGAFCGFESWDKEDMKDFNERSIYANGNCWKCMKMAIRIKDFRDAKKGVTKYDN